MKVGGIKGFFPADVGVAITAEACPWQWDGLGFCAVQLIQFHSTGSVSTMLFLRQVLEGVGADGWFEIPRVSVRHRR